MRRPQFAERCSKEHRWLATALDAQSSSRRFNLHWLRAAKFIVFKL